MMTALWILVGVASVGVAFIFSGMEAGLGLINRYRIRCLARHGDHRAVRLQRYLEHPEHFLWTILVGNTLALFVLVTLATLGLHHWLSLSPLAFMGAIVGVLLGLYVLVDLTPKLLFRRFPNRLCLACVGVFRHLAAWVWPMVRVTEWASQGLLRWTGGQEHTGQLLGSRAEVRRAMEEASGSLSREQVTMINRILDLPRLRVGDVMTPMSMAATLEASMKVADFLNLVRERRVSFVPVWRRMGKQRRVHGVVALTQVLYGEPASASTVLEDLVQPALYVKAETQLDEALRTMQRGRQRLAVVLGPDGRETGVVTLNDILRAMFGEVGV